MARDGPRCSCHGCGADVTRLDLGAALAINLLLLAALALWVVFVVRGVP